MQHSKVYDKSDVKYRDSWIPPWLQQNVNHLVLWTWINSLNICWLKSKNAVYSCWSKLEFYMVLHLTDGEYNLRPSPIWVDCDFYWIYIMVVHFHLNCQHHNDERTRNGIQNWKMIQKQNLMLHLLVQTNGDHHHLQHVGHTYIQMNLL